MPIDPNFAVVLPELRKFAHALTGSRASGDAYLRATLDAFLAEPQVNGTGRSPQAVYRMFHVIWSGTVEKGREEAGMLLDFTPETTLTTLPPSVREAVLLRSIGKLNEADIAVITQ